MTWDELRAIHPSIPESSAGYSQHANGGGWVADSAIVAPSAYVSPKAFVGEHCVVGADCRLVEHCVVGADCRHG